MRRTQWDGVRLLLSGLSLAHAGGGAAGCKVADKDEYTFAVSSLAGRSPSGGSGGASSGESGFGGHGNPPASGAGGQGGTEPVTSNAGTGTVPAPTCPAGQHLCAQQCVRDDDVNTCGKSCSPCEAPIDGFATCDGVQCGASCRDGKELCLGICADPSVPCAGECPEGTHECSGLCSPDSSVNACGDSCSPCPVPPFAAQASCTEGQCGFECSPGYHRCGDACVADDDPSACGNACQACPTDTNGTARCFDGTCVLSCKAGYHLCNDQCVSNTSPATCGEACEPCAAPGGGTATCTAGTCGASCPSGQKLCAGACIAQNTACEGTCPSGTHDCGGVCVADTSTTQCGTACVACQRPTGARDSTCKAGACDFTCDTGYHRCGNRCVADSDATACGTACVDCPDDPNGTALCQSGTCGLRCATGFHLCSGRCVSNTAVATCGSTATSCEPCVAPTGGSVTCNGLACVPACPTGQKLCGTACIPQANACNGVCPAGTHNCSGVCRADTNVNSCGDRCSACPSPAANGKAACVDRECAITCNTGFHLCGASTCSDNTSIASCGSSCTPCTAPANAEATCNGTSCGFRCRPGFTGANCELPRFQPIPLGAGAISADGRVVVGGNLRWVVGTAAPTAMPGLSLQDTSMDISADGLVVVGTNFRWSAARGAEFPRSNIEGVGYAIYSTTSDGALSVGAGSDAGGVRYGFLWQRGAFDLEALEPDTQLYDISDNGAVMVGSAYGAAARFPGGMTHLPITLPGNGAGANAISADGRVIAGYDFNGRVLRWSGTNFATVQTLPAGLQVSGSVQSYANAISANGSVIVGGDQAQDSANYEAVLWNANGSVQRIRDILTSAGVDLSAWVLVRCEDVSADGKTVIGVGITGGNHRSWLARLP